MKTTRRQELKTNELATQLQKTSEYLQQNGTTVLIAGVVVVVFVVAVAMFRSHSTQQRIDGWDAVFNASASLPDPTAAAYVDDSVAYWERVLSTYGDSNLQLFIHQRLGDFCLYQAPKVETNDQKTKLLDTAERSANYLLDHAPARSPMHATALSWKSIIEQNRFAIDGDVAHKDRARGYLEQLRNDTNFQGTAIQNDVLDRLEGFDELWQPVVYADPPPIAPVIEQEVISPSISTDPIETETPVETPPVTEPPASDKAPSTDDGGTP